MKTSNKSVAFLAFFIISNSVLYAAKKPGNFTLVNSTNVNWVRTSQSSEKMNWNFPDTIKAYTSVTIEVIWKRIGKKRRKECIGRVSYKLANTNRSFEVVAKVNDNNNRDIRVYFKEHLSTKTKPRNSSFSIGWHDKINKIERINDVDLYVKNWIGFRKKQNGNVTFILSGVAGHYSSTGMNGATWMQDNFELLHNKTIREISIPGTHDAGASVLGIGGGKKSLGSNKCNTKTQSLNIKGQLEAGVRWFDIRPVLYNNTYFTGHFSEKKDKNDKVKKYRGSTGQSIKSMVMDINAFTKNRKELIILYHKKQNMLNIGEIRMLNKTERNRLIEKHYSKIDTSTTRVIFTDITDISNVTLDALIHDKSIVIIDFDEKHKSKAKFSVNNRGLPIGPCVKGLAEIKNQYAAKIAYEDKEKKILEKPCISYDFVGSSDVAALAMAINWKNHNNSFESIAEIDILQKDIEKSLNSEDKGNIKTNVKEP